MTDTTHDVTEVPAFGAIGLVDDARAMKILTGKVPAGRVPQGVVRVTGPRTLEWTGPDRVVELRDITYADLVRDGVIGVDYQGASGPAVAVLLDRSQGARAQARATAALAPQLRSALGLPPKSKEENEAALAAAARRAEAKLHAARTRMVISGLVCAGGAIATAVNYSNAEPGSSYTLWWGAIVFGLLWFVVGALEYASAAKERTAAQPAGTSTTPGALEEGWSGPPPPPAAVAPEPTRTPPTPEPVPSPTAIPAPVAPPPPVNEPEAPTALGVRFDVDRLAVDDYRADAWRVIWNVIEPADLGPGQLREGDTAGTLARRERVLCIAVYARAASVARLKERLATSPEFQRVAADPPFIDSGAIDQEPLTSAGSVGEHGALEGRSPMVGLNAAREGPRPVPVPAGVERPASGPPATTGTPRARRRRMLLAIAIIIALLGAAVWLGSRGGQSRHTATSGTLVEPTTAPVAHAIKSSIGDVPIVQVTLADQYPAGCLPSDVSGCLQTTGNRVVVIAVGAAQNHTMDATESGIAQEFFQSSIIDSAGGRASPKWTWRLYSSDTMDLVYDAISVDNPTSLTLNWPGTSPISLDF